MVSLLKRIVGDTPERAAEKLSGQLVPQVNALEDYMRSLDGAGLSAKTVEFRRRLSAGETLADLLPEAFAVGREAARRTLGQRHYDVQLIGGAVLNDGKIAEMKTGEGKTLVATLPAYLNALTGDGVHIVTVNDYLARRDPVWMGPIFHLLGLSVGCLQHDAAYIYDPELTNVGKGGFQFLAPAHRSEAYQADVLYGTNNEFGFDYLRDNMALSVDGQVQRGRRHFAIVDEVDNILIDEARTPLIISGPAQQPVEHYYTFARLAPRLQLYDDYEIDERSQAISLTQEGIGKMERWTRVDNLYDTENFHLVQYIENALVAQVQKVKDKDYVVQTGEVVIVDEFTGRLQSGRRWSDGLHQAVEAKEGCKIQRESVTYATITLQNYFRMYQKLSGMTGTAVTEADEFYKIYGLEVVAVPTNLPMVRAESTDLIFPTAEGKWRSVVESIATRSQSGQPVLVGTTSIETSEELSERLRKRGVEHQVLNARNHEHEATIVAQAGRAGSVTVSTNMAGRGTDIVLGGSDTDREGWQDEHQQVVNLGGLHVIGTEHHEARRVDNQLRGRAGRQGDPGSSQFFVALEDELMQRFGGDRIKNVMSWTGLKDDEPLENKIITKSISSAQVKVEGYHFDVRKHLLNFDDVLNQQREVIYTQRSRILAGEGLRERLLEMLRTEFEQLTANHLQSRHADDWNADGLLASLGQICPLPTEIDTADKNVAAKERDLGTEQMQTLLRLLLLKSIDTHWVNHLTNMENLRTGVGLHAVGQRDPLAVYRSEGQRAFAELTRQMQREVTHTLFHVTLSPEAPGQGNSANGDAAGSGNGPQNNGASRSGRRRDALRTPVSPMAAVNGSRTVNAPRGGRKIGRNAPCPCGSGRKYKRCCGANV
ncbi:Protein translocase subunit SecA [Geodia barretti]|uniref:Protein translocase subunit SecA n=1 Tax=Geodia barretti TaxID=519541 RepID=A0AA35U028_GEOBA|nr:Protein translocase subunit SecA [Geodia barretti]